MPCESRASSGTIPKTKQATLLMLRATASFLKVEEAMTSSPVVLRGRDGRYLGYGTTADGRLLFVVLVPKGRGRVKPLTARPMTNAERRLYQAKRRTRR